MRALGSDAAIETADVVLMTDSPLKMVETVEIVRQTRRIVWQKIVMPLSIKLLFVVFGAMGMASMWEAVFADIGVVYCRRWQCDSDTQRQIATEYLMAKLETNGLIDS